MLLLRNQVKIYHWQTKCFSRHKASDELVEELDRLVDKYVETYQGIYSNLIINKNVNNSIQLKNIEDDKIQQFITSIRKLFIEETSQIIDTELLNIRDEILQSIDKTLYLYKLE